MSRDTHTAIIELGISLGYFTEENNMGICNGLTMAWISACMLGQEECFKQRIQCIMDEDEEKTLPEKLNLIKAKVKLHEQPSDDEVNLLEILAFYEQVLLFQTPNKYPELFKTVFYQQNIKAISELASSQPLLDRGGLSPIHLSINLYTKDEVVTYLERLAKAIDSMSLEENASFSFALGSHNHEQSLIYVPARHSWTLMDINQWPPKEFIDTQELARKIFKGFNTRNYAAFSTQFITTLADIKANKESFQHLVTQLNIIKKDYSITAKTVERPGIDRLICLATTLDDIDTIKELGALNVNLSNVVVDGVTPAYLAAARGSVHLIKELGILKADLNKATNDSATPAHIAAQEGQALVIKVLGEQNADLNKTRNDGTTPAFIAAECGHMHVIQELGLHNVDFNKATKNGATPLFVAAQEGHAHIVRYLVQRPDIQQVLFIQSATLLRNCYELLSLDVQQKFEEHIAAKLSKGEHETAISVSAAEIAYIMGHDEIVEILKGTQQGAVQRFGIFKVPQAIEKEQSENVCPQNKIF